MSENTALNAPLTEAEEIAALSAMGIGELRVIAEAIGATNARAKTDLAQNIVARAREQGITYAGYVGALAGVTAQAASQTEEEDESQNGKEHQQAVSAAEQSWFDPYALNVKHLLLWVSDIAEPDPQNGVYDVATADEEISRYLKNGYEPAECFTAGFDPRGHRIGWVLKKAEDGGRYTEAKHVLRTLTSNPDPGRNTVTGFQADAYISALIEEGWQLAAARFNGIDAAPGGGVGGFFIVWFLVR